MAQAPPGPGFEVSGALHPMWGHETLRSTLTRAVLGSSLPATILLHGPRGAGKQRLALWIAQLMLCEADRTQGPCGACRPCRMALKVEHPDLHWYFPVPRPSGSMSPEKLAEGLEQARGDLLATFRAEPLHASHSDEPRAIYLAAAQSLRRRAQRRPSEAAAQVFIVGDAETLVPQESSPEAANVLLKLLEEPPEDTRFILTSSEVGQLLPTLRSRALPLFVPGLQNAEVERFLVTVAGRGDAEAARAARLSHGSIGRALGFLPDAEGETGPLERLRVDALDVLEAALARSPSEGYRHALGQRPWGARGLADLLDALEEWMRDLTAVLAGVPERVLNKDHLDRLGRLAAGINRHPSSAARTGDVLEQARIQADGNVNPQLLMTGLISGIRKGLIAEANASVS